MPPDQPSLLAINNAFRNVAGNNPTIHLRAENKSFAWAHEAGVFLPSSGDVFITSNRLTERNNEQKIIISKINMDDDASRPEETDCGIPMANGGVNYKAGVLFCGQGTKDAPAGLWYLEPRKPYDPVLIVSNFNGRPFNSPNDVVVYSDGSIWFTDPIYGFEQGFRPPPQLPNQVYRFDPATGGIRAVADGLGRPNGISFSPDESTLYVTDTDFIHGDGTTDPLRPASIYAFDVVHRHGQPFLANRRLFAMSDNGVPDGIKCDEAGNVYSGCGDGIHVWSAGGVLLGKILIPGGVSNFCFCRAGEILALNETRVWQVKLASTCIGSLVKL